MSYSEDERRLLAVVPQLIGSAIASASASGIIGSGKELFASISSMAAGLKSFPNNALIRHLFPDRTDNPRQLVEEMHKLRQWATARLKEKGVDSAEKLEAAMLEETRAAAALLAARATAREAQEYKNWALSIAENVAKAASEGGFLGFGGERVSAAERDLIEHVRAALDMETSTADTRRRAVSDGTPGARSLSGRKVLITAGPTREPLGGGHFITTAATGAEGYSLAEAAVALGAETILVSGPVGLTIPPGAQLIRAETAADMLQICEGELPCDLALLAAGAARWRRERASLPLPVETNGVDIRLTATADLLTELSARREKRPSLVVGFLPGGESEGDGAGLRLRQSRSDLVVAEAGSEPLSIDRRNLRLVSRDGDATWSRISLRDFARRLCEDLAARLEREFPKQSS